MDKVEQGQNSPPAGVVEPPTIIRRKRKVGRPLREKTPEASKTGRRPSDEGSSGTVEQPLEVQAVQLQLRPPSHGPSSISTHKSKILSRKNKSFSGAVARSSSTPRQENGLLTPETYDFLRIARRSLSSPRHKEESSESGRSSPHPLQPILPQRTVPPKRPDPHSQDSSRMATAELSSDSQTNSTSQSRLEKNLNRFEEERRRFEVEKKRFEKEKRDLTRMRYKLFDSSDRRFIADAYRKINDKIHLPLEKDDKQIILDKFLEAQHKSVLEAKQNPRRSSFDDETEETDREPPPSIECPDYESSTATISESELSALDVDETDADDEGNPQVEKVREKRTNLSHSSTPTSLRKRHTKRHSLKEPLLVDALKGDAKEKPTPKKGFFSRIFSVFAFKKKNKSKKLDIPKYAALNTPPAVARPSLVKSVLRIIFIESRQEWRQLKADYGDEVRAIRLQRNKCMAHLIFLIIFCGFGGLTFRFIEGKFENTYKCGIGRVKRDFIDYLWQTSHNLREDDWKSQARLKLRKFEEELHSAHESGMTSYSGTKSWSFMNSLIYSWTVVTTIGYGHISPTTVVGRAVTIVYAIIGIPIFLILLADFGKLFTRGIKFLWVFVRRLYYTGTVRNIRKHQQIQQMMQGMNIVYEIAMRRPTLANLGFADPEKGEGEITKTPGTPQSQPEHHGSTADTPTSPAPETFLIDDEFNLPISVAIIILLLYIFLGAAVYCIWEDWTYFESIYFVFISMSTVGFGDFVPQHPIFMMCSIAYLIFGLALTSMCINVVQVKLSDSFKQASAKIGATIGFEMSDEEAMSTQNQTPVEMSSIPPSPKFERSPIFTSNLEQSIRNFSTDSPPPVPRRSPLKFNDKEKEKEKDKAKNKKSKK